MQNAGLDELQAGIKITWRSIDNLIYVGDALGTKEPLMRVKEESQKTGLKLNIQKTNIMASS